MEKKQNIFGRLRRFQDLCWNLGDQSAGYKDDFTNWESLYISRKISIWITFLLKDTGITPDQITALWFLFGIMGAFLLVFHSYWISVAGIFLIYMAWILDNTDGELARYKKIFSPRGNLLDMVAHDLIPPCIFAALTLSCVLKGLSPLPVSLGLLATIFVTPVTKMQEKVKLLICLNTYAQGENAGTLIPRSDSYAETDSGKRIFNRPITTAIAFIFSQTAIIYLLIVAVVFKFETLYLLFYGCGLPVVFVPKYIARAKALERIGKDPGALKRLLRPEWLKF